MRKLGFVGVGGGEQRASMIKKLGDKGLDVAAANRVFHAFEEVDRDRNRSISRIEMETYLKKKMGEKYGGSARDSAFLMHASDASTHRL